MRDLHKIVYSCFVFIRSREWHVSDVRVAARNKDVTLTRSPAVLNRRHEHTARPSDLYDVAWEKLEIICFAFILILPREWVTCWAANETDEISRSGTHSSKRTLLFWSSDFYFEGAQFWQLIILQYILLQNIVLQLIFYLGKRIRKRTLTTKLIYNFKNTKYI